MTERLNATVEWQQLASWKYQHGRTRIILAVHQTSYSKQLLIRKHDEVDETCSIFR